MNDDEPGYERSGNPEIPDWWWKIARPILENEQTNRTLVAAVASRYGRRESPWGVSAITKFLNDDDPKGRTVAFTNALSLALSIPRPFYTAPTEAAAREMALLEEQGKPANPEPSAKGTGKLAALDAIAAHEERGAIGQRERVSSKDEGADRSGRPRRTPRRRA